MIVYSALNSKDGKRYIGQTKYSLEVRIQGHIRKMNSAKSKNNYFQDALKKHGVDNFVWEVLCKCFSKEELDEMEYHYIRQYKTFVEGYNLTEGGEGTWGSPRNNSGENNPFFGLQHSELSKEKISKRNSERIQSDETKKKISDGLKEAYASGRKVYSLSEYQLDCLRTRFLEDNPTKRQEVKDKISASVSGEKNPGAKKFLFIHESGEEILVIGGMQKFCEEHKLSFKSMRKIADGVRKSLWCNGWTVERR